jgi:hypothetical protein
MAADERHNFGSNRSPALALTDGSGLLTEFDTASLLFLTLSRQSCAAKYLRLKLTSDVSLDAARGSLQAFD